MSLLDISPRTKLTQNFRYHEVIDSDWATRHGIDNRLPEELWENALAMAHFMEIVRSELNRPINVSSWFRNDIVNAGVGGSKTSMHPKAMAVDFRSPFGTPLEVCNALVSIGLDFDQLIYEGTWTHIGITTGTPRRQIMTAKFPNGKAVYSPGINP